MPIIVVCQSCKSKFKAPDKLAGYSKKCPQCNAEIEIPLLSPQNETVILATPVPTESDKRLSVSLKKSIENASSKCLASVKRWAKSKPKQFRLVVGLIVVLIFLVIINMSFIDWSASHRNAKTNIMNATSEELSEGDAQKLLKAALDAWQFNDLSAFEKDHPDLRIYLYDGTVDKLNSYTIANVRKSPKFQGYEFAVLLVRSSLGADNQIIEVTRLGNNWTIGYKR